MADEIRADLLLGRDTLSPALVKAGRGAADASSNVRDLTKNLYELGKQRATPVVDLNDKDATAKLKDVTAKLDELGKKAASPGIDVKDKDAVAKLAAMRVKLDALGQKVASPRISLDGVARAGAQILALDAQLDRLGKKHVGIGARLLHGFVGGGGGLKELFGGAGGSGGKGLLGLLGQGLTAGGASPYLYGGAAGLAALLAPSVLPLGLGGLVGAGAGGLALKLGSTANKQLVALEKSLASAKGPQKAAIAGQIKTLRQQYGPELSLFGSFKDLGHTGLGVLDQAFRAPGPGNVLTGAAGPSFFTGLTGIFKQLSGFIKTLGPDLGRLFASSIPYLRTFVGFLEQAAKILLPAFTQTLNTFAKSGALPLMEKGLLEVVKGFAGFLKALGPQGMKASAQFFVFIMKVIEIALIGLGKYINDVATKAPRYVHNIANAFDWLRHHTATVFDGIRHDVAHYWDMTWNNTIGTVIRFGHNVETQFDSVKRFFQIWVARLEILFAGWAKNILHYAQDAFGWLPNFLPGVSALKRGLDTAQKDLASFVSNAQSTLHRLTAKPYALDFHVTLPPGVQGGPATGRRKYASGTTGAAAGWALVGERGPELVSMRGGETVIPNHALRGYASGTGGVVVHLSSPSVRELASVLGSYVSHIVRAIQSKYFAAIPAAPGVGGGVARWAPVALQALRMLGQPAGDLGVVLAQMQTESGGNPLVVNKWDSNWLAGTPSVGLMQVIGPTFGAYAGPFRGTGPFEYGTSVNPLANIYAGLNYAIHRYGAAWTRVLGQGHGYDHGGYLQPGWNLAYNGTGRPEPVTPARGTMGAGGTTVYLTVQVGHGTHPVAAAQEIVKLLNVGARNGVRLRSSILGPG